MQAVQDRSGENSDAAADFPDAADVMCVVAAIPRAWSLSTHGLRYLSERRDKTWARLMVHDIGRRDFSTDFPGIPLETSGTARRDSASGSC
jgi:hypothetical protein